LLYRVFIPASAAVAIVLLASVGSGGAAVKRSSVARISGTTRVISASGTASLAAPSSGTSGGTQNPETPAPIGDAGGVADRSNSSGGGNTPIGVVAQPKPVTTSTPGLETSFAGLDHFDNRFGTTSGGNQFSLEPPDQGLCVGKDSNGNTRILEALNDVLDVYDTAGNRVAQPTALNAFLGYPPGIVRTPSIVLGQFVTDPSCLYDSGHWFLDVLTIDSYPTLGSDGLQHFPGTNHIDLAVSQTSDPMGAWTIYRIPVQDDGTGNTPNHGCSAGPKSDFGGEPPTNPNACFGDYPHIGADANGIYITTNEYSFFGSEFHGAQIYAFPKVPLLAGAGTVKAVQFDTHGMDTFGFGLNGFTLWPSTTPGGGGDATAGGTEYFLSTNAAPEAHDTGDGKSVFEPSTQLLTWALTNTSSLDSATPAPMLSATELN
jgi:hypothetical protein